MKVTLMIVLCIMMGMSMSVAQQTSVLIYTKNGEGYVHDNIEASVTALQKICSKHNIETEVSDDPSVFTDENLRRFHVIIFSNTNNEGFDTDEQRKAFVRYIRAGGGFMGIHSACASERQWPWFWANMGGFFVRHPKLQEFDIKIVDADHASTSFLPDTWAWEDECYLMNHLNPDINILLAVDLRTIEDDQIDEYPGDTFGNYFPLAWYHEFEGGRQFYTALGHKIEHYDDPNFVRHLEGGLMWILSDQMPLDYSNVGEVEIQLIESEN